MNIKKKKKTMNWKSKCQSKFLSSNAKLILTFLCPTFYKTKFISNDLILSLCIYFLLIIEDSSKVINGGMSLWYAWHIAMPRFEKIITKLLLIQFTFLFCALRYWRYSLKAWLCLTSCVALISPLPP
jgi:hypothetical protein